MLETILLALMAGIMIPLGGWLAAQEHIQRHWLANELRHSVIAFGGGALLSAVAFVLIPEGEAALPDIAAVLCLAAGALIMARVDAWLDRTGSPRAQLIAMLADFIPETIALGAVMASGEGSGLLLALLIGLQNLPEGFNAYREQREAGGKQRRILLSFAILACLGPVAALTGYTLLVDFPAITGALMLGAAGAILYLIFQDIAPDARLKHTQGPPLAAVGGFLLGMLGHLLIG